MPTLTAVNPTVSISNETIAAKIKSIFEKPLSKAFFPDGTVREKDVRSAFGNVTLNMAEVELTALVEQVMKVKTDVISWGKNRVHALLLEHSKEFLHGINNWDLLGDYWRDNGTEVSAAILWQICYGAFDFKINWELDLEKEYMENRGYAYEETNKASKGCIARSFALRKSEAIKILNNKTQRTHKGTIYMSRKNLTAGKGKKFAKRKKGTTIGDYATIGKQKFFGVEKVIQGLRDSKRVEVVSALRAP